MGKLILNKNKNKNCPSQKCQLLLDIRNYYHLEEQRFNSKTQEKLFKHKKKLFYCEDDQILELTAKREFWKIFHPCIYLKPDWTWS